MRKKKMRFCTVAFSLPAGRARQEGLDAQATFAQELEDLGYELLTGADDPAVRGHEQFVTATLLSMSTKKARLTNGLSTPLQRHPTIAAAGLSLVQRLSGGRMAFVVGKEGGVPWARAVDYESALSTAEDLEEYAVAVRTLCDGKPARYRGHTLELNAETEPVPVHIFASGPDTLAVTGRVADGALIAHGVGEVETKSALKVIGDAAAARGLKVSDLDLWWAPCFGFARTTAEALAQEKAHLAGRCTIIEESALAEVPEKYHEGIRGVQREYRFDEHRDQAAMFNAALVDKYGLTDYMAERHGILGSPEQVVERIHQLAEWGVTGLLLRPGGATIEETRRNAKLLAEKVFSNFN